ncbi:uncharacterized protein N7515_003577 [Penicillium bovifimosum]|uniref:Uncharacterized protein n=1 Tax=Penicillium bovifimosum TaxID=126998 RepID=A0A9W9H4Y7_9EURO|nr:uncharacterized protein N7515_003577 [Penicillium bovifimosum]KAJ5138729.1 hypothetical protein N7515_003577 [Penicillium bovifimosum]
MPFIQCQQTNNAQNQSLDLSISSFVLTIPPVLHKYSTLPPSPHTSSTYSPPDKMPAILSWQDNLLQECTTFKHNLQSQSSILRHRPAHRHTERNSDASRAVIALSLHTDRIVEIGLSMISNEPGSALISRDPSYWHREGERRSTFESVFMNMERELDQMALSLKRHLRQQECREISARLEEMAGKVEYILRDFV